MKYRLPMAVVLMLLLVIMKASVPVCSSASTEDVEVGFVVKIPWVPGPSPINITIADGVKEIVTVAWPQYVGILSIIAYCIMVLELVVFVVLLVTKKIRRQFVLLSILVNLLVVAETVVMMVNLYTVFPTLPGLTSSVSSLWTLVLAIIITIVNIIIKLCHYYYNSNGEYRMEYQL